MASYKTKYFGELTIDEENDYIDVTFKNSEINLFFSDVALYGEKIKTVVEILDRYEEIDNAARKAIVENYASDETISYYFESYFEDFDEETLIETFGVESFDEFDVAKAVEKLDYPSLIFGVKDDRIEVSFDYMVSKENSDQILCVKMDDRLNVTGFSHES